MNVLLLFEYPTLCGGEQSQLTLTPLLRAAGCRFRAACPPHGPLAESLAAQEIEVLPLTLHDQRGIRRPLGDCRSDLAAVLSRCRPDLLHANSLSTARLSGPVAADLNISSVGHLRDIVRLSRRAIGDINGHHRLRAVSNALREFHLAQGLDGSRTAVLYNGVDLAAFCPCPPTGYLHRELGLPADSVLIGSIGQLGPRKGTDLLLQAAATVVEAWPQAVFLIVGQRLSGKDESRQFERSLHDAADGPRLAGRVHFLGWRTDVADALQELAVVVHAARQEPLGRVLLEAAAAGRPVVATRVGGTPEIFPGPAPPASLVPPDNPSALAAAIVTLVRDDQQRAALGHAARHRAEAAFGADQAAAALFKHYQAAL